MGRIGIAELPRDFGNGQFALPERFFGLLPTAVVEQQAKRRSGFRQSALKCSDVDGKSGRYRREGRMRRQEFLDRLPH
jgi:hypothetical protein